MTKPELEARVRDLEAQVSVLMDVINMRPYQIPTQVTNIPWEPIVTPYCSVSGTGYVSPPITTTTPIRSSYGGPGGWTLVGKESNH